MGRKKSSGITVNAYSEGWLRKGFPWVYPKEVTGGGGRPGDLVRVRSAKGEVLGRGVVDDGFVRVRVFRHDDGPIDAALIDARMEAAAALRERVVDPETSAYRLVNAENDGLPGIRVDWWDHYATVILDRPSLVGVAALVEDWLQRVRAPRGIVRCYRKDPREHGRSGVAELVAGRAPPGDIRVTERGIAFRVRPLDAPDVGLYPDMREVRAWMEPHWGGRSVCNTFAFTGAFSVAAAMHGASEVVTVDLSDKVLERAEANFAANELDPSRYDFVAADTFKALDRFRRTGRRFDVVVLDPPAFSRGEAVWSAKKDYPRLIAASCRVLEPGGWLIVASNQGEVSPRDFRGFVVQGLRKAGRRGVELFLGGQGPDYPAASWFPEGRYLKVAVWSVV